MTLPVMTPYDIQFLIKVREFFGERAFSSAELAARIHHDFYPDPIIQGLSRSPSLRKDPVRMFGGWLPRRAGWKYRGLTLQKLSRVNNAQQWRFGVLPGEIPEGREYTQEPSGRWYWTSIGLWPDEVTE